MNDKTQPMTSAPAAAKQPEGAEFEKAFHSAVNGLRDLCKQAPAAGYAVTGANALDVVSLSAVAKVGKSKKETVVLNG